MRRSFALGLVPLAALAALITSAAPGCGSGSPLTVQDLCGWLGEENGCYRRFARGVAGDPPACGVSAAVADDPNQETTKRTRGVFTKVDSLDTCLITAVDPTTKLGIGGSIKFSPAFKPAEFPPAAFTFTIVNPDGTTCGSGSFTDTIRFSITINDPSGTCESGPTDGAGGTGTTTTTTSSTTIDTSPITCGTFSSAAADQPEIIDVSCPNGEAHEFNLYQLNKCTQYQDILPAAEVEAKAGVSGTLAPDGTITGAKPGYVKLRVFYPPLEGTLESVKPIAVEYFDCQIPPPVHPCVDGMKSDGETDVDCGGFLCTKCVSQKTCISQGDCAAPCNCEPDPKGVLRCCGKTPPP